MSFRAERRSQMGATAEVVPVDVEQRVPPPHVDVRGRLDDRVMRVYAKDARLDDIGALRFERAHSNDSGFELKWTFGDARRRYIDRRRRRQTRRFELVPLRTKLRVLFFRYRIPPGQRR